MKPPSASILQVKSSNNHSILLIHKVTACHDKQKNNKENRFRYDIHMEKLIQLCSKVFFLGKEENGPRKCPRKVAPNNQLNPN